MEHSTSVTSTTRALIDLSAFRHNLAVIRSYLAPGIKIVAVVKAHAYGHGLRVIAFEAERCGVDYLGVARADEGIELRNAGIRAPVLVFEVVSPVYYETAIRQNLELTVSTVEGAESLGTMATRIGKTARIHIKVDTGMGRLGFTPDLSVGSIQKITRFKGIEVVGVYSHFATSESQDQTFARTQLDRFMEVKEQLERLHIEIPHYHMANSGALISLPVSHLSMVRPGIMLFGYTPSHAMTTHEPLKPVLSLLSKISLVKTVEAHTSISYGRKYFTAEKTRIATVPIGYGDGYLRSLTNKAEVLIHGKRYPVAGSVCMDHVMVDIGMDGEAEVGEDVTLIGRDGNELITCWELAERAGTIPYEITCLITPRVPRLVVNEESTP